jgi:hypothetical protein
VAGTAPEANELAALVADLQRRVNGLERPGGTQVGGTTASLTAQVDYLSSFTFQHEELALVGTGTFNAPASSTFTYAETITVTLTERRRVRAVGSVFVRQYAIGTASQCQVYLWVNQDGVLASPAAMDVSDLAQSIGAGQVRMSFTMRAVFDDFLDPGTYVFSVAAQVDVSGSTSSIQVGGGAFDVEVRERPV